MSMKTIPEGMRPYERLERCGAEALSDAELLAVLVKSGTREKSALTIAEELLLKHGSLADIGSAEIAELRSCKGIGRVKAIEIHAAAEVGKRIAFGRRKGKVKITDHEYLSAMLMSDMKKLRQEVSRCFFFDKSGITFPAAGFRPAPSTGRSSIRGKYFTTRSRIWRPPSYLRIIIRRGTACRAERIMRRRSALSKPAGSSGSTLRII